jgi:hypothetical protein
VQQALGRHDRAIEDLSQAIEHGSRDQLVETLVRRGYSRFVRGDYVELLADAASAVLLIRPGD